MLHGKNNNLTIVLLYILTFCSAPFQLLIATPPILPVKIPSPVVVKVLKNGNVFFLATFEGLKLYDKSKNKWYLVREKSGNKILPVANMAFSNNFLAVQFFTNNEKSEFPEIRSYGKYYIFKLLKSKKLGYQLKTTGLTVQANDLSHDEDKIWFVRHIYGYPNGCFLIYQFNTKTGKLNKRTLNSSYSHCLDTTTQLSLALHKEFFYLTSLEDQNTPQPTDMVCKLNKKTMRIESSTLGKLASMVKLPENKLKKMKPQYAIFSKDKIWFGGENIYVFDTNFKKGMMILGTKILPEKYRKILQAKKIKYKLTQFIRIKPLFAYEGLLWFTLQDIDMAPDLYGFVKCNPESMECHFIDFNNGNHPGTLFTFFPFGDSIWSNFVYSIIQYNIKNGKFSSYPYHITNKKFNSLPLRDYIETITYYDYLHVEKNKIWLAGQNGIYQYDKDSKKVNTFLNKNPTVIHVNLGKYRK